MKRNAASILIADNDMQTYNQLYPVLQKYGYEILYTGDYRVMNEMIKNRVVNVVLFHFILSDGNIEERLAELFQFNPLLPVIVYAEQPSIRTAISAIKAGAFDFLEKPIQNEQVIEMVKQTLKAKSPQNFVELQEKIKRYQMIGAGKRMNYIFSLIDAAANTAGNVLISGESGTGKELVARAIHKLSSRKDRPFVQINCAAINENLIESELFGYQKGAFTGADVDKEGVFHKANKGTLLLDEIGNMSINMQIKLLRTLENGEVHRVGSDVEEKVDVRIISATNFDLHQKIDEGLFRMDLFYRLNMFEIHLPPLRHRLEDIPILSEYFISNFSAKNKIPIKKISPQAMDELKKYNYPGNVRELQNILERLIITTQTATIEKEQVLKLLKFDEEKWDLMNLRDYKKAREEFEKRYLRKVLDANNWNITKTAKTINYDRSNLYKRIKQLGLSQNK